MESSVGSMSRPAASIAINGPTKAFGANVVLHGIDLHVPAGQFLTIIGKSGCGKSTLAAHPGRARPADIRRRAARRRGGRLFGAHRPIDVPGAAAAALGASAGQRRGRPRRAAPCARWRGPRARQAGGRRPRVAGARLAVRPVGRPEAARGAGPRAGEQPAIPRPRRTARRARCADPHRDAGTDRACVARAGFHGGAGHARRHRSDRAGRPRRADRGRAREARSSTSTCRGRGGAARPPLRPWRKRCILRRLFGNDDDDRQQREAA